MPLTDFRPHRHGFHFADRFPATVVTIPGHGNLTSRGRSGGMAFAALDYYAAELPVPSHSAEDCGGTGVPADGGRLGALILSRHLDSFATPTAPKFMAWPLHEDGSTWLFRGLGRWTREDELDRLRAAIDAGRPVPIGLIGMAGADTRSAAQAVAFGFEHVGTAGTTRVFLYDPGHPDEEVVLTCSADELHLRGDDGSVWRGFFVQDYTPRRPTYVDLAVVEGLRVRSAMPTHGEQFTSGFRVRNLGELPARAASLGLVVESPAGEAVHVYEGEPLVKPIAPGEERGMELATEALEAPVGEHRLRAVYRTAAGELSAIPPGEPGARSAVMLQVQPHSFGQAVISIEIEQLVLEFPDEPDRRGPLWLEIMVNDHLVRWPRATPLAARHGARFAVGKTIYAGLSRGQPLLIRIVATDQPRADFPARDGDAPLPTIEQTFDRTDEWGKGPHVATSDGLPGGPRFTLEYRVHVNFEEDY